MRNSDKQCNRYNYSTAADYARLTGHDRTTIVEWIKAGKLRAINKTTKSHHRNRNCHWRIAEKEFKPQTASQRKKPSPKSGTSWTDAELYILRNNMDKPTHIIAKMTDRSEASVRVKACRERKKSVGRRPK